MSAQGGAAIATFDALYDRSSDPWGTTTRWYERRKRSLLLAALDRERYGEVYEAGCGTGHISVCLADRCDVLLVSDASAGALAIAAERLADKANVTLERHVLPDDWPMRPFDLLVLSELLYFTDAAQCARIARHARASAGPSGTVVACDWRAPIEGLGHDGDAVHRHFEDELGLPRTFEYIDDDFVLTGWSADVRTAAIREGLR